MSHSALILILLLANIHYSAFTTPVEEGAEEYPGVEVMMTRAGQQAFSSKISPAAPGI